MTILTPNTKTDYFSALKKLMPTGKAWNLEEGSNTSNVLEAFSLSLEQLDEDSCEVIDEVFPGTSTNLLPLWQETVGLEAGTDTIENQRNKVIAKLTQTASLSKSYYVNYIKQLGYEISITEYSGIISGLYSCGDSVGTADDYTYQFMITVMYEEDLNIIKEYLEPILPAYIKVYYLQET